MIFGIGLDGGMADEVWVPERTLVPIPAALLATTPAIAESLITHRSPRCGRRRGESRPGRNQGRARTLSGATGAHLTIPRIRVREVSPTSFAAS